jgi:hypothetical protein
MAGFTIYRQMFIFKLVIGLIVIKTFYSFNYLKRLLSVTLTAILTKLILMGIFMAGCAIVLIETEILKFLSGDRLNFVAF